MYRDDCSRSGCFTADDIRRSPPHRIRKEFVHGSKKHYVVFCSKCRNLHHLREEDDGKLVPTRGRKKKGGTKRLLILKDESRENS